MFASRRRLQADRPMAGGAILLLLLALCALSALGGSQAQNKYSGQQQERGQAPAAGQLLELAGDGGPAPSNGGEPGEHVDKLASASGDPFWGRPSGGGAAASDWYRQLSAASRPASAAEQYQYQLMLDGEPATSNNDGGGGGGGQYQAEPYQAAAAAANLERSYRTLVSDFKRQLSPLRESRAFKPKLMSTARGFGKRALASMAPSQRHLSYADLLAADPNSGLLATNGKMSPSAISAKYSEWINQVLSRWPTMDKYVNDKSIDYNGDGTISTDEKYQSL